MGCLNSKQNIQRTNIVPTEKNHNMPPCNHKIDQSKMRLVITESVQLGKTSISCPLCAQGWELTKCFQVAKLSRQQEQNLNQIIMANIQMKKHSFVCQSCGRTIQKNSIQQNERLCYDCAQAQAQQENFDLQSIIINLVEQFDCPHCLSHIKQKFDHQQYIICPNSNCSKLIFFQQSNERLLPVRTNLCLKTGLIISSQPDPNGVDYITLRMPPCMHNIGQVGIKAWINKTLKTKKTQIKCSSCTQIWDTNICLKVANYKQEELNNFNHQLNNIFMSANTYDCPFCDRNNEKSPQIKAKAQCYNELCPFKGYFCIICKKKWLKQDSGTECGNMSCISFALNASNTNPMTKILPLSGVNYPMPMIRLCPYADCRLFVHHTINCKHMTCQNCRTEFCYVCMKLRSSNRSYNDGWPCGGAYQYCGTTAPAQNLAVCQ